MSTLPPPERAARRRERATLLLAALHAQVRATLAAHEKAGGASPRAARLPGLRSRPSGRRHY
ncbi:MAG TPA: hypothetical protein VFJ74_08030 [Gemmatimonadaceae bacterium]|nr:hypothetical protein [Gemmatimonadaceae bacterium]